MELDQLEIICSDIISGLSDEKVNMFIEELDKIKEMITNSSEKYIDKLNMLKKVNFFVAFNDIFSIAIMDERQFKILTLSDFLIQTCGKKEEIEFLFTEGLIQKLISYQFSFSSLDILRSYVTILKGISLKLSQISLKYYIDESNEICPLFTHAISFICHEDSIVVAAARLVVLNIFLIKSDIVCDIATQHSYNFINHLLKVLDSDVLSFIADFLNVAPKELVSFTANGLKEILLNSDIKLFARSISFLYESKARSVLSEVISRRLKEFDLSNTICLGVLNFIIEKRLILYDDMVYFNMITPKEIPTFSKNCSPLKSNKKFLDTLAAIFMEQPKTPSIAAFTLVLRIFEHLHKSPPTIVYFKKKEIIKEICETATPDMCDLIGSRPQHKQRTDLEYLLSDAREPNRSRPFALLYMLVEIECALARWSGRYFSWFQPMALQEESHGTVYGAVDGSMLTLGVNKLKVSDGREWSLWDLCVAPSSSKIRRTVTLLVGGGRQRRKSLVTLNKDRATFEFSSMSVALALETEIATRQLTLIRATLVSLNEP